MHARSSSRHLSIWLRRLATDRIERSTDRTGRSTDRGERMGTTPCGRPLVTAASSANAMRLTAVNDAAAALGLNPGMALADARARHPEIAVAAADPAADGALLERLADACERYTPVVALDAPDGLMLDMTGAAHLFGGEEAVRRNVLARLQHLGLQAEVCIADTPGCAWAVARFGDGGIVAPGCAGKAMLPLPVAALRLDASIVEALSRLGLTRIADIAGKPRAPLAARFGTELLRRLDQAFGREDEAIAYRRPPPAYRAERAFAEPILLEEHVLAAAERLALSLAAAMERQGQGARRIELALFRVDGASARIAVGTGRPVRDAGLIRRLLSEKMARQSLDPGYGFDLLRLSALVTERLPPSQLALTAVKGPGHDLADLVDRLAARLGGGRIMRLAPRDEHVPELAVAAVPAQAAPAPGGTPAPVGDALAPVRPVRLFERPEPIEAVAEVPDSPPASFRWRGVRYRVVRAEGPERIAMPWWRAAGPIAPTRDYFRVEVAGGRRVWLYREGLYDRETASPRWFLHGLYA